MENFRFILFHSSFINARKIIDFLRNLYESYELPTYFHGFENPVMKFKFIATDNFLIEQVHEVFAIARR